MCFYNLALFGIWYVLSYNILICVDHHWILGMTSFKFSLHRRYLHGGRKFVNLNYIILSFLISTSLILVYIGSLVYFFHALLILNNMTYIILNYRCGNHWSKKLKKVVLMQLRLTFSGMPMSLNVVRFSISLPLRIYIYIYI